jgi:predicted nucleic acid-binding protein
MSVIYLDTSALVKLVVDEPESAALARWLDERPGDVLCSSVVSRVELIRAARRRGPQTVPAAVAVLAELALVPLDPPVLEVAAELGPSGLRTLDALHLASAATLGSDAIHFVAYDGRLLEGAELIGIPSVSPA